MLKNLLLTLGVVCVLVFAGCEAEYQGPLPLTDNYIAPSFTTPDPSIKLYVNDQARRVVYVNEEFEIKVALYSMPQYLTATTMDIDLGNNIAIERIMYDTTGAGYFAKKESTLTLALQYPGGSTNKVSFVKTYLNGTTPNVISQGVLLKIRCKAISRSNGPFAIHVISPVFWQMFESGVVGVNTNVTQFYPIVFPVTLEVRDDLFVP